ncbi:MAG TPA: toxin, partial [Nitrospirae bacterium]|nr:toxin [Nitrospirota bacterium]
MKYFTWNDEKNEKLKTGRNISFEEVVFSIERGYLLDILEHSNRKKYHGQKIFVVQIEDYACLVPFIEEENQIFLKTIIPGRKAARLYLKGGDENA